MTPDPDIRSWVPVPEDSDFPIQNMPHIFQWISYSIPLRYYITVLRGVFLKGAGLDVLWPEALAMVGLATLILTFARLRYRVRLG